LKVSVVVPAYNLAPYIHECLLSVLAQKTDLPFEVIVCDDASSDQTLCIIEMLAAEFENLVVLRNRKNLGLVGTMKRLLESAQGEFIAYMDGDDIALPGKLQRQYDYLDEHPQCGIVYHESDVFDSETGATLKKYTRDFYNFPYIPQAASVKELIKYSNFLQASSVMVRRYERILESLQHGCRIICDFPWHIMNAGLGGGTIDRLDQTLGRYRVHGGSFGAQTQRSTARRIRVADEMASACRLGGRFGVPSEDVCRGVNHIYFSTALYFLRAGELEAFREMLERSSVQGLFFDDRHEFAFENLQYPEKIRQRLGWT